MQLIHLAASRAESRQRAKVNRSRSRCPQQLNQLIANSIDLLIDFECARRSLASIDWLAEIVVEPSRVEG